jgi:hypothetical protein
MRKTREKKTIGDSHTLICPSVPVAAATIPVPLFMVETAKQRMQRWSSSRGCGPVPGAGGEVEQQGIRRRTAGAEACGPAADLGQVGASNPSDQNQLKVRGHNFIDCSERAKP